MKTKDQKPNNSDGDSAGDVMAFNSVINRWQIVGFNAVQERMYPYWEKLPDAPAKEEPALPEPTPAA